MKNASFKYRDDMEDVLKDISFDFFKNQRVGIIGRTGAGKSSLTLAVSKIISISGGEMMIDGIDAQDLDHRSLREKISVIPQDAFLYDGTLRLNLDPNGQFTDAQLYKIFYQIGMDKSQALKNGLDIPISVLGDNLSQGEK